MSPIEQMRSLAETIRLLDEAYVHYFEHSDGYCKSSEGHVSISFGNYFERRDGKPPMDIDAVEIYSYVLGPSRSHYFSSLPEALATVREWHEAELKTDYSEDGWGLDAEEQF